MGFLIEDIHVSLNKAGEEPPAAPPPQHTYRMCKRLVFAGGELEAARSQKAAPFHSVTQNFKEKNLKPMAGVVPRVGDEWVRRAAEHVLRSTSCLQKASAPRTQ